MTKMPRLLVSVFFPVTAFVFIHTQFQSFAQTPASKPEEVLSVIYKEAREFVADAKLLPQVYDIDLWHEVTEKRRIVRFPIQAEKISEIGDSKTWVGEDHRIIYVLLNAKEYESIKLPLKAVVYQVWNGKEYQDLSILYHNLHPNPSEVIARTAALVDGKWYLNRHKYDGNNKDADIRSQEIGYIDKEGFVLLSVKFLFDSTQGVKEIMLYIPRVSKPNIPSQGLIGLAQPLP